MDKIFSLDISISPAQAVVLEVDGVVYNFLDALEVDLVEKDFFELLVKQEFKQLISQDNGEESESQTIKPEDIIFQFAPIKELYRKYENEISSSILVVPPCGYLSLNIDLPFNSAKLIRNVISGEVQDLIPFDINRFVLNHSLIDKLPDGYYDVHAAMLPDNYIASLLEFTKAFGFDPEYITTPSAALGGEQNWLASKENQIIVSVINQRIYANCLIKGKICSAQLVDRAGDEEFPYSLLKMFLLNIESRYQTKIDQILLLGNSVSPEALRDNLRKNVVVPEYKKFDNVDLKKFLIAGLAALSVSNPEGINLITNFRTGKFSYQPYTRKFLGVLKRLWVYLLGILLLFLLIPAAIYFFKDQQIIRMEAAISSNVKNKVPELNLRNGKELDDLMAASSAVEAQLDNLGSASKVEPFEVYVMLSEILAEIANEQDGIDLLQMEIKGDSVVLDGTVPSYKGVDKIKRLLQAKESVFCDIRAETPGGRSADKKFKFTLRLC